MILNWGKNRIDFVASVNGAPASGVQWSQITEVREGTTVLTPTEGTDLEARIEGGEVIDRLPGKNSYMLDFEVYVQKDEQAPFADNDGVIAGNYALRVVPVEDESCPAIQINNCIIKAMHTYNTTDGWRIQYRAMVLKPASGNSVKRYDAAVPAITTFTLSDDNGDVIATQSTASAPTMTAGDIELNLSGTNISEVQSAHIIVGNNVINLVKDGAGTSSAVKFVGTASAGVLTSVVVNNREIKALS